MAMSLVAARFAVLCASGARPHGPRLKQRSKYRAPKSFGECPFSLPDGACVGEINERKNHETHPAHNYTPSHRIGGGPLLCKRSRRDGNAQQADIKASNTRA